MVAFRKLHCNSHHPLPVLARLDGTRSPVAFLHGVVEILDEVADEGDLSSPFCAQKAGAGRHGRAASSFAATVKITSANAVHRLEWGCLLMEPPQEVMGLALPSPTRSGCHAVGFRGCWKGVRRGSPREGSDALGVIVRKGTALSPSRASRLSVFGICQRCAHQD